MKKIIFIFIGLLMVQNSFAQIRGGNKPKGTDPYANISAEGKRKIHKALAAKRTVTGIIANVDVSNFNAVNVEADEEYIYELQAADGVSLKGYLHGVNLERINANKISFDDDDDGEIYVKEVEAPKGQFLKGKINQINFDYINNVASADFSSNVTLSAAFGKIIAGKIDTNSDQDFEDEVELSAYKAQEIYLRLQEGQFKIGKLIAPEGRLLGGYINEMNLGSLQAHEYSGGFCDRMFTAIAPEGKVLTGAPYGVNITGLNANNVEFIFGHLTRAEAVGGLFLRGTIHSVNFNQFNASIVSKMGDDVIEIWAYKNSQITGSYAGINLTNLNVYEIGIDPETKKIVLVDAGYLKTLRGQLYDLQFTGMNARTVSLMDNLNIYANDDQLLHGHVRGQSLAGLKEVSLSQ